MHTHNERKVKTNKQKIDRKTTFKQTTIIEQNEKWGKPKNISKSKNG